MVNQSIRVHGSALDIPTQSAPSAVANSPPKNSDFWSENHKVVHVSGDDVLGANQSQNNSLLSKTEGPKVTLAHDESGKEYKSALSLGKKPIKKGVSLSQICLMQKVCD